MLLHLANVSPATRHRTVLQAALLKTSQLTLYFVSHSLSLCAEHLDQAHLQRLPFIFLSFHLEPKAEFRSSFGTKNWSRSRLTLRVEPFNVLIASWRRPRPQRHLHQSQSSHKVTPWSRNCSSIETVFPGWWLPCQFEPHRDHTRRHEDELERTTHCLRQA